MQAIVVGAGLFGSVIGAELARRGCLVTTIDDHQPHAGSKPAACLMKPSWISGLGADVTKPALGLLDTLYGLQQVAFKVGVLSTQVFWVDPASILLPPKVHGQVQQIRVKGKRWEVVGFEGGGFERGETLTADVVVVAAGIWTPRLVPVAGGLSGQAGVAFLWHKESIGQPLIKLWAPYKQTVAFNRGDGLWVGDGSSIKRENWTIVHEQKSLERCQALIGKPLSKHKLLFGIRPYSAEKPCYLREHLPGLWVATGGAKNGLIAAAWAAGQIAARVLK